ncbi:peroxisome assembly protein (Peroxin-2) [Zalaria obscura]|uniref:Peroxisome assembly protein (Peroxin-2) n=1 Tax=Zalaria obscura TaxID=2024903 RepID=A0ACC3SAX1_9PEZI
MSSPDFAAAQQRILARRAARSAAQSQTAPSPPPLPSSFLALPLPLRQLAQQSLGAWNTISSPYGTRPYFRVGQVDAELLDEELLGLLKGQVADGLKYFGGHLSDEWGAEIGAALRAVLWKLSIWDRGTSYGGSLQGLRYVDARGSQCNEGIGAAYKAPARWQKGAYGLLTVGGRYAWQKWEDWLVEREGGYEEPNPLVRRLGRISGLLSSAHEVAALVSFCVFLFNGKYRTLVDRLLRLRLAPSAAHTSREVSFEYLNRQLVWHAFTEFLLFILPLVGISRWRRWLARAWRKAKSLVKSRNEDEDEDIAQGELGFLPERTCAICYRDQNPTTGTSEAEILAASGGSGGVIGSAQTDVTNPYETIPCGCVYCFVCLAQRIEAEEGEGWTCLRCGEVVKECKPWSGDVIEEVPRSRTTSDSRPGSRKSVVFADEAEEEQEEKLKDVDPMPLEDEEVEHTEDTAEETDGEEIAAWPKVEGDESLSGGYEEGDVREHAHARFE